MCLQLLQIKSPPCIVPWFHQISGSEKTFTVKQLQAHVVRGLTSAGLGCFCFSDKELFVGKGGQQLPYL